jgi:hypothetical protein
MTFQTLPDTRPVASAPVEPVTERCGTARFSFLPGSVAEAVLVYGPRVEHFVITDERSARDLYACLDRVFGPLAETRRAVTRSVALAGDVR